MRYAQGGGLAAEGRGRREQVRMQAVKMFGQRAPTAKIAAELRVTGQSVRRWRKAWLAAGPPGLASKGQAAQCGWAGRSWRSRRRVLEAGPLAAGYDDQRWTLGRVRDLIAGRFRVRCTIPGTWYLLRRRGWTCRLGARRAPERDDAAIEVWEQQTWARAKRPGRPPAAGSSSTMSPASR